jgi:hypothetical protein
VKWSASTITSSSKNNLLPQINGQGTRINADIINKQLRVYPYSSASYYVKKMDLKPVRFISEPIEVHFDRPPLLEKKPDVPNAFTWRKETFRILELLSQWVDYERTGRSARNMQPAHAAVAGRKGSWGVGVFSFRVRAMEEGTSCERIFDIYYDRAPKNVDKRKGAWFVFQELAYQC